MDGVTLVNVSKIPRPTPDQWPKSEFTGEPVDPYSEAWRHECECRFILDKMSTRPQRAAYLEGIEQKRGKPSADKIKTDILFLHYMRLAVKAQTEDELKIVTDRTASERPPMFFTVIDRIKAEWLRRRQAAV